MAQIGHKDMLGTLRMEYVRLLDRPSLMRVYVIDLLVQASFSIQLISLKQSYQRSDCLQK